MQLPWIHHPSFGTSSIGFPMTHFTFRAHSNGPIVVSPRRHPCLFDINVIRSACFPESTIDFLSVISQAAADGIFPSLRDIRVYGFGIRQSDQAQINQFSQLGLTLEFTGRYDNKVSMYVPLFSVYIVLILSCSMS